MRKRLIAGLLAGVTALGLTACGAPAAPSVAQPESMAAQTATATLTDTAVYDAASSPKYVFLYFTQASPSV